MMKRLTAFRKTPPFLTNHCSRIIPHTFSRSTSFRRFSNDGTSYQHDDGGGSSILILSQLFPQPSASAAGVRTAYIAKQLCQDNAEKWGTVHYSSSSKGESPQLLLPKVKFHHIPMNDSDAIGSLVNEIGKGLKAVIYDRFYTEEAFSFRFDKQVVHIVDMQDMHSLRQGRQKLFEKKRRENTCGWEAMLASKQFCPGVDEEMLLRELASIHRSDLTLVCSPFEMDLLCNHYQVPKQKLCLAPFWVRQSTDLQPWDTREHFCFIGGYRHKPNVDAVEELAAHIWPKIKESIPEAQMHVYGAYVTPAIQKLDDPTRGFHIKGFCENLDILSRYRVMLAPLRFGAGIKGKIIDAWEFGLPVVTTPIGSEGMLSKGSPENWGGCIARTGDEFCRGAMELYLDRDLWHNAAENSKGLLQELYDPEQFHDVSSAIDSVIMERESRRGSDFVRSMLWHQTARSTEYFARWLECKGKSGGQ